MKKQTLEVKLQKPQRTAPHSWRSFAGGRSTLVKSLMAGGFSMSAPITVVASTSWRRGSTVNLVTGVLSTLQFSPSNDSQSEENFIESISNILNELCQRIKGSQFCMTMLWFSIEVSTIKNWKLRQRLVFRYYMPEFFNILNLHSFINWLSCNYVCVCWLNCDLT